MYKQTKWKQKHINAAKQKRKLFKKAQPQENILHMGSASQSNSK